MLGWLDLPDSERYLQLLFYDHLSERFTFTCYRPSFMTLYVEEPDHTGHESGPQSKEVRLFKWADRLIDGLIYTNRRSAN